MKNIKTLAVAAALGLAVCGFAFAHGHNGVRSHGMSHVFKDAASGVEHLTEFFPRFAAFDVNKDGQLDAAEKESLARAITEGKVQLPSHTPPNGATQSAEITVDHIAAMYAQVAAYDTNHDGALDAAEQAALKEGIESGDVRAP